MKDHNKVKGKSTAKYGDGTKGSKTNQGASTGLKQSNEMRSDTTKAPTSGNPFPNGLS